MSPSFSLSGPGHPDFHMNSETGVITTKEKLDREDKSEFYNLVAFAEDRESGEACRVDIRIRILDENDHAPKFTERGQYVVTVKEDAPVGALIGKVHADDEDVGLNRKVRYALLSVVGGGSSNAAAAAALSSQDQAAAMIDDQFGMDGTSGVISLLRPLDRELVSQYNLTIQVMLLYKIIQNTNKRNRNIKIHTDIHIFSGNFSHFSNVISWFTLILIYRLLMMEFHPCPVSPA